MALRQADRMESVRCTFMWEELWGSTGESGASHRLLQLQHWLKTEPLRGVSTDSKKLAPVWEFYS